MQKCGPARASGCPLSTLLIAPRPLEGPVAFSSRGARLPAEADGQRERGSGLEALTPVFMAALPQSVFDEPDSWKWVTWESACGYWKKLTAVQRSACLSSPTQRQGTVHCHGSAISVNCRVWDGKGTH